MILIEGGRVISPKNGIDGLYHILADGDKIVKISEDFITDLPEGTEVIDASGKLVLPGFVDMHVHLRDPGQTHKEDIYTGCAAAAAGGVTSVACMPNTTPPVDTPEVVRYILDKAKDAKARVYPVACVTKGMQGETVTDMAALKAAGAVAFSDDGRPVKNARVMMEGMRHADCAGRMVLSHCEDLDLINGGIMHKGDVSRTLGVPGMDRASEDAVTAREICLADSAGVPVHICHVSTKGSVELIRHAKRCGVKVTCETAPHYFILDHEKLLSRDAEYRMNPPLREQKDIRAVLGGIADGTIDCIITDHAPHTAEEKADFMKAPNGVVGLETSFAACYTYLVKTGVISLRRLVEMMSETPASLLGIPGGCLEEGGPADIAIADPEMKWTVDPAKLHSKSKNTVFKGMTLQGKVVTTLCRGEIVYNLEDEM